MLTRTGATARGPVRGLHYPLETEMTGMNRYTTRNCSEPIRWRENFTTSGALMGGAASGTGILPHPWDGIFMAQHHAGEITYAVYSYDTPIAWYGPAIGWVFPDVKYSVTTSNHQGNVRRAGIAHSETPAHV